MLIPRLAFHSLRSRLLTTSLTNVSIELSVTLLVGIANLRAAVLDSFAGTPRFFPTEPTARWIALKRQALADGLMDAALLLRYEQALRPEPLRWVDWMAGQQARIMSALDAMDAEAPSFGDGFDIGHIATACAVGYLDLRFGHFGWRDGRPRLAAWFADVCKRPSLISTFPKG